MTVIHWRHISILSDDRRGIMVRMARDIDAEGVNQMATLGRGVLAITVRPAIADRLGITYMPGARPREGQPTFLCSVEATACEDSGISALDRALTLQAIGNARAPSDIVMPGHIMPFLIGDLSRPDLTLPEIAHIVVGGDEGVAWCDILDDRGDVASPNYCCRLARNEGIPLFRVIRAGENLIGSFGSEMSSWHQGSARFSIDGPARSTEPQVAI